MLRHLMKKVFRFFFLVAGVSRVMIRLVAAVRVVSDLAFFEIKYLGVFTIDLDRVDAHVADMIHAGLGYTR